MKILALAIACHPERGSESYVGWMAVNALAKAHELTVITHGDAREAITERLRDHPLRDRLRFHFLGGKRSWHPNRLLARFQDWADYRNFCAAARGLARDLVSRQQFDVAHHITYASWRAPSPLVDLGIPLVFGPVGGGETFPQQFYPLLSRSAHAFERLRVLANAVSRRNPAMRRFAAGVSRALANNHETCEILERTGVPAARIGMLSQSFFTRNRLEEFRPRVSKPPLGEGVKIFAGGNLEGRKGVAITLHVLADLRRRGVKFRFRYGGMGAEFAHLQRLAADLGLTADEVSLGEILSGDEYRSALAESHIYLLPSLREGAPVTMIEAMASGCVPVVAACGGAGMLVDGRCGVLIPVTSISQMVDDIAGSVTELATDSIRLATLSSQAVGRVATHCLEEHYCEGIEQAYSYALADPA